jgi:hypothetical protein
MPLKTRRLAVAQQRRAAAECNLKQLVTPLFRIPGHLKQVDETPENGRVEPPAWSRFEH